jgi:hypothetical protein
MDLENRQTNTDIRTNKTNKKNERERAMFKSQEKKTKFFWIEETIMMILFCEEDTHWHTFKI